MITFLDILRSEETSSFCEKLSAEYLLLVETASGRMKRWYGIEEIFPLIEFLQLSDPLLLKGIMLEVPGEYLDPQDVLDFLFVWSSHGGNYEPPTSEELLDKAIASFAQGHVPDFSGVDELSLGKFILNQFELAGPRRGKIKEAFCNKLRHGVKQQSGGLVVIKNVRRGAKWHCYFWVESEQRRTYVAFGPYTYPFSSLGECGIAT